MSKEQLNKILDKSVYNNIVLKNDINTKSINKALILVKKYIIKHKKILVGGMSIDMALRKKGSKLYSDDEIPDYDIIIPTFHIDAYDIANILIKNGLSNIGVIGGLHPSTMRVRVNFIPVMDCTYIPKNLYNILPTLDYGKFIIIHPFYQYIDQHLSLSMPYKDPPRETIMNRWEKDMTRYDLLYKKYPLLNENPQKQDFGSYEFKFKTNQFKHQCLGGFVALIYWTNLARNMGFKNKYMPQNTGGIINEHKIEINISTKTHGFTLFSDNLWGFMEKLQEKRTSIEWINAILDKLPRKILISNKWEIFDNKGSLITAHKPWKIDVWVTNIQYIMNYMLTYYIIYKYTNKIDMIYNFYISYLICRDIIIWASNKYYESSNDKYLKFLPTAEIYGSDNWSTSYLLSRQKIKIQLKEEKDPHILYTPKNAYPEKEIEDIFYTFDPTKSPIYQFDGKETGMFNPKVLP